MVSVRKRGKVYEYRFEIATVEGTRKWITKSGYPTKSEAFKEGAKAYNDFYYNGTKTQSKEKSPFFGNGGNRNVKNNWNRIISIDSAFLYSACVISGRCSREEEKRNEQNK